MKFTDSNLYTYVRAYFGVADLRFAPITLPEEPIEEWDVSEVTHLDFMFSGLGVASEARFVDLRKWNVSKVQRMEHTFYRCHLLVDISTWDVRQVVTFKGCFFYFPYNIDVSGWKTNSLTDMTSTFRSSVMNSPLNDWDVSQVTSFERTFQRNCLFNQPLDRWDVRQGETFEAMFHQATEFNQPLRTWALIRATNLDGMFCEASSFRQYLPWVVTVPKVIALFTDSPTQTVPNTTFLPLLGEELVEVEPKCNILFRQMCGRWYETMAKRALGVLRPPTKRGILLEVVPACVWRWMELEWIGMTESVYSSQANASVVMYDCYFHKT